MEIEEFSDLCGYSEDESSGDTSDHLEDINDNEYDPEGEKVLLHDFMIIYY